MTLEVVMPDARRAGGNVASTKHAITGLGRHVQRIVKSLPRPSRSSLVPWPE